MNALQVVDRYYELKRQTMKDTTTTTTKFNISDTIIDHITAPNN